MSAVVWTDLAIANLETIRVYIAQFNPIAAGKVADEIISAANDLVTFAHRGRPVTGTELRELVTRYPYILRYRIDGDTVVIIRIRHASKRPTSP